MLEEVQVQRNENMIPPTMTHSDGARAPQGAPTRMWVLKRNGSHEPVDINKIVRAVERCAEGLDFVDPMLVASRTISGLYAGASTKELDQLSIRIAASLIVEEPEYAKLAARLLATYVDKEVALQDIHSFSQSVGLGHKLGLVNERMLEFVTKNSRKLNDAISTDRYTLFEYFGLRTLYDRYLLKHPTTRQVIETPQHFFMRVSCALSENVADALELYELLSTLSYLPSSPTLFNSGTRHEQLSSCFLLDSPQDTLENIYQRYTDVAMLSKFSGGIGMAFHRVRSRGSLIRSTNGQSNGIVPWLKTLDASVCAVNQCFAPETRLFTADGIKTIRDVQEGDLVLGISGTYCRVTQKMTYNQRDPMVSINIKHSIDPVRVTSGHPLYAICGVPMEQSSQRTLSQLNRGKHAAAWVDAGQLRAGDYVAQVIPTEVVPVTGFTEDDARMYGILLGDGHMTSTQLEWGVSGNPQRDEHMSFVRSYLEARGVHFWETSRGETYGQVRWASGQGVARDATSGRIVGAGPATMPFDYEDLYDEQGNKRIARRFAHLPRPQALALLQGLIETDGGISRGAEIYFTNTSMPLVEGVRYQLLRLGVPCAGQYREREQDHTAHRSDGSTTTFQGTTRAYDLRIPAVEELATLVGCKPVTKRNWITWQGCVFSRVREVSTIEVTPFVMDLVVEGDESYMTTAGLAHNGGKRKGACCVYLESWHADIDEFLELRDNTGDEARRTHNLNLANWVSDLFMRRVETDGDWSLFDPKDVPTLTDLWGDAFTAAYEAAEQQGLAVKTIKARDLYGRMMRTLAQTGNGWMTFKDKSNRACNQTLLPGRTVHLSNLCTEIIEVTSNEETAVCLAQGTQILTEHGLLPIEQCDGKRVYVPYADDNARHRADRFAHATLIDNGERDVVAVQLADGRTVTSTADHRFLVRMNPHRSGAPDRHEWREAGSLSPGDRVVTPHTHALDSMQQPIVLDNDWAAAGWLVGDGWQREDVYGVCFAAHERLAQREVMTALERWHQESPLGANTPHDNFPALRVDRNGVYCWASSRRGFIDYVQHRFGITPHLAAKKELPKRLDLTDHVAVRSFLSGLFSADGHIGVDKGKPYIALTSASQRLILQVRSALTAFGVHARIRRSERPDGRVWFILNISGGTNVSRFKQLIGFSLSEDKQTKLDASTVEDDAYRNVREYAVVASVSSAGRARVYDLSVEDGHHFIAESVVTHNCNLGSINLSKHLNEDNTFDFDKLGRTIRAAVRQLDRVIDLNYYPIATTRASNMRWRPVGLGLMGLQDVFFSQRLPFDSEPARALSAKISEEIYYHALSASCELAEQKGMHTAFPETRASQGELQFDAWDVVPQDAARWDALRERIKKSGLRNSLLIAIAPTATIASIASCYECIEPQISNLFKRETLSGDFLQINRYLVNDLKTLGLWTEELRTRIKVAEGSIQGIEEIPEDVRAIYRTAWEVPMRSLIDMAADRGAFIDQSQSLNLFMESPNIGQLSSMYMYAWKKGVKTTYYLRSRPATRIAKTTVKSDGPGANIKWGAGVQAAPAVRDADAVACSLENPESCEACQ